MNRFLLMLLSTLFCAEGLFAAEFQKGYFEVSESAAYSRPLYYEYKAAKAGAPTFVFLNGLTYETRFWESTAIEVLKQNPDAGILMFDFWGQGKTLLKAVSEQPWTQTHDIPAERQAADFIRLVKGLNINGPITAVGLSYGGGIAALSEMIDPSLTLQTVMVSPYLEPATGQDPLIKDLIRWVRLMYPFNQATDEQLYDYFLRQIIFSSFPAAEPVVIENPFKLEGVYRLIQGIRKINIIDLVSEFKGRNKVHLVQPLEDQYIPQSTFDNFWLQLSNTNKGSRVLMERTEHRVPEDQPKALAHWVSKLAASPDDFKNGKTWQLNPDTLESDCATKF